MRYSDSVMQTRRTMLLRVCLIFSLACAFMGYAESSPLSCPTVDFMCTNRKCIKRSWFCDGTNDCGDNSDEAFCNKVLTLPCPQDWVSCPSGNRCIPKFWNCDRVRDCPSSTIFGSKEPECVTTTSTTTTTTTTTTTRRPTTTEAPNAASLRAAVQLKSWFLGKRRPGSRIDRWGSEVHRIAVALHLAEDTPFKPGDIIGEEIRYELMIQLQSRLSKDEKMSSQELALYIHALLVACMDPRDFNGEDLVSDLRRRVEAAENYTNPFLILALCNAGDTMTTKDLERVTAAYDSQHRPFWTDSQALACMALSCISSNSELSVDERVLKDMLQELKRHQFRNGTVDNFRTTALVTQALFIHDSYTKDFDLQSATNVLMNGLLNSKSLLNAYYVLPVLGRKSLLNVSSSHCIKQPVGEEEALQRALEVKGETINVQYSVWFGDEINLARTWRLKMRVNSTIYDAIETVAKIDNRQKVEYSVVDGKPYVTELNGKQDDPERGVFWFVCLKNLSTDESPKIVEESPVDLKLKANQEIILWYKRGPWNGQGQT